jgi:tRNA nucleotidyltransferase/poly(A) polymerase
VIRREERGRAVTSDLPSLAGAAWLAAPVARTIFDVLEREGDEVRIVGGAVRNALLDLPVRDIDFATTATPEIVKRRALAAGLKVVPTGIEHGTVTLVGGRAAYEVTTLREDIATDGRRAVVRFGRDWEADARRRDFTVNALSVDASGTVHDPVGGYPDIVARHIRFIGDADRRIAEDRLRILRFFRFHAEYGEGPLDGGGLSAAIRARNGLRELSAERIGQEMRRLLVSAGAVATIANMQESGILEVVLGGVGYLGTLARLAAFEAAFARLPAVALRLAALAAKVEEDVERLTERLRLSNVERDAMLSALASARSFMTMPDERAVRHALYRFGAEVFRDGVALAFAEGVAAADDSAWGNLYRLPERWQAPSFPLSGRDVIGIGGPRGPATGALLRAIETWWIERDFVPDAAALRKRLEQIVAAEQ